MLEYDRIDISEGIDTNKTSAPKECNFCHYWYFLDRNFHYGPYLCHGCHYLMQIMQIMEMIMECIFGI